MQTVCALIVTEFDAMLNTRPTVFIVVLLATIPAAPAAEPPGVYERELQKAGIGTDRAAVVGFLKSLSPDPDRAARAAKWLKDLGSRDFHTRSRASRRLSTMNDLPLEAVKAAADSSDPEIRWRARLVLEAQRNNNRTQRETSVLQVLIRKKYTGLTELLLPLLPRWNGLYEADVGRAALLATTTDKELPSLRKAVKGGGPGLVRSAAVYVLAMKLGTSANGELLRLLNDRHEAVRLEAARGLAEHRRRECLPALVALLDSNDRYRRSRASQVLRGLTKQNFGYVAYDSTERRKASLEKWNTWLREKGKTATLVADFKIVPPTMGRILYCDYGKRRLVEFDRRGRQTFVAGGFRYIWGSHALPNGRRLAVDYSRRFVVEYDATGKEVWRYDRLPGNPSSVEKLPNGNVLLALTDSGLVAEVSPGKKIVWKIQLKGRPTTAQRLPNGVTVVNLQFAKKVVDVDRTGKVLRELTGINNALTAQRLPNGNTLVCEMGRHRVREIDPRNRVVWSKDGFRTPAAAQRLPNGNTLVSDSTGIHEIDPSGKEIWSRKISRGMFFHY